MNADGAEADLDTAVGDIVSMLRELDLEQLSEAHSESFRGEIEARLKPLRQKFAQQRDAVDGLQRIVRLLRLESIERRSDGAQASSPVGKSGPFHERLLRAFPPEDPEPGLGILVAEEEDLRPPPEVDCLPRLPICQAACCHLYQVHLTPREARGGELPWNSDRPYVLEKKDDGRCFALDDATCQCGLYGSRPKTCRRYSCQNDERIWEDFEAMRLNPALARYLAKRKRGE